MPDRGSRNCWQTYRFDEMATMVSDRIDDPSDAKVDKYVGLEHLDSDSLKIRRWGSPSDVEATKLLFRAGDIIFGKRRAYQRKLGVADFDGICSAHAMVLRARPEVVFPDFLPFFMQSDLFMERAKEISVGSLSPTINWRTLAEQRFALPPLEEQRRIVELIAATDAVFDQYERAWKSCVKTIESLRIREFDPSRYRSVLLSSLCQSNNGIQIGPFGAQLHRADYRPNGVPVVMPVNMVEGRVSIEGIARVSENKAQSLAIHRVRPGDILLPRRGELDKRAHMSEENAGWLCGSGSIRIRVAEGISSRAVFHALASPHTIRWLHNNAVGSTMPNLNTRIVGRIPLSLPPVSHQARIAAVLDALVSAADSIHRHQGEVRSIKVLFLNDLMESTHV